MTIHPPSPLSLSFLSYFLFLYFSRICYSVRLNILYQPLQKKNGALFRANSIGWCEAEDGKSTGMVGKMRIKRREKERSRVWSTRDFLGQQMLALFRRSRREKILLSRLLSKLPERKGFYLLVSRTVLCYVWRPNTPANFSAVIHLNIRMYSRFNW